MYLELNRPYLSIKAMNGIELPAFSILIGRNGVGKTQFLDAIANANISVSGIATSEIEKYDINNFAPGNSAQVLWGNCAFAEKTVEQFLAEQANTSPKTVAERIYFDTLEEFQINGDLARIRDFEETTRDEIRQLPDFECFRKLGGNEAITSYSQAILDRVIKPLLLRNKKGRSSSRSDNRTCGNDPAILVSLTMKLTGKLPHEVNRDDILSAAHYEGTTIANKISQTFTRYKVEQYSWAHRQGEASEKSIQYLMQEYRQKNEPPWVQLRDNLKHLRSASDDPQLFNYEFSDPEDDEILFANHLLYSFASTFTNCATGEKYSLDKLSSGEKILMSLCLATFNKALGQRQPRLLLFDELDAVLHPSMISGLLAGLKNHFVSNGTQVIMATHSVTTVSLLKEGEIYRIERNGGELRVYPTPKGQAIAALSEGLATIDVGLRIATPQKLMPVTILTEGHNAIILRKWANLFFPEEVEVFDGLPSRTGKDQLLAYGQLLSRMHTNSHFLIVWDCDAKATAERLAKELTHSADVTPFALEKRTNSIAHKGIENKFEEKLLAPYSKIILDGVTR